MHFLHTFHHGEADLECVNRAMIVLQPKTLATMAPSAFRPVSLQNYPVKILTKVLTSSLQLQIATLIDPDQTGFINGRSISENFVLATEMVQTCHKRRAPTLVLKLDFAKPFDSVNWGSLLMILRARGFPDTWCAWMERLLATSKSAVLVNGVPRPWISCKRGLRQGDAHSPYLFILVADVLQRLIKADASIKHPLTDGHAPVLQYADNTIILVHADHASVQRLKATLDMFAAATGLVINYNKSTATPMHVRPAPLPPLLEALGCHDGSFPQTYLGLPLSNVKLPLAAFAPLIARVDRYLASWKALLLSTTGRVVLINAVLGGLPTYAMGVVLPSPGVVKAIDARRRVFLWTGTDTVSCARCLIAWDDVCKDKEDGGLGIRRLDTQNVCLLLKLLHRLHHPSESSWALWVSQNADLFDLSGRL